MKSWQSDKSWADKFIPEIAKILTQNAGTFLGVSVASDQEDMERATDLVVTVIGGQVAVKIRRDGYKKKYRDWTIRSFRKTGSKTELQKLIEGFAQWYLYLWTDNEIITDWILINMDKVRATNLLYIPRRPFSNNDGTYFIAISVPELKKHSCLVDEFRPSINYQAPLFRIY